MTAVGNLTCPTATFGHFTPEAPTRLLEQKRPANQIFPITHETNLVNKMTPADSFRNKRHLRVKSEAPIENPEKVSP